MTGGGCVAMGRARLSSPGCTNTVRSRPLSAGTHDIAGEYLPLKALAVYAGLSVRTLRGYLASRSRPLPYYRGGGKILVRRGDFDAWVSQFRAVAATVSVDDLVNDVCQGFR